VHFNCGKAVTGLFHGPKLALSAPGRLFANEHKLIAQSIPVYEIDSIQAHGSTRLIAGITGKTLMLSSP
jgi:hypothetical protein